MGRIKRGHWIFLKSRDSEAQFHARIYRKKRFDAGFLWIWILIGIRFSIRIRRSDWKFWSVSHESETFSTETYNLCVSLCFNIFDGHFTSLLFKGCLHQKSIELAFRRLGRSHPWVGCVPVQQNCCDLPPRWAPVNTCVYTNGNHFHEQKLIFHLPQLINQMNNQCRKLPVKLDGIPNFVNPRNRVKSGIRDTKHYRTWIPYHRS